VSNGDDPAEDDVRRAFQDLYLLSLPNQLRREAIRELEAEVPLEMTDLANLMERAPVHRLYKFHAVASAVNRRPTLAEGDGAPALAQAMGRREDQSVIDGLQTFANAVKETDDRPSERELTPERWRQFLEALGMEGEDADPPAPDFTQEASP
jgi:hypothetical protein